MWSSRFFWKLFLVYAGISLFLTAGSIGFVSHWQEAFARQQVDQRLRISTMLFREIVESSFPAEPSIELQHRVTDLAKKTGTRATLVAMDGTVMADSEQMTLADVKKMENHKERIELVQASKQGEGSSRRMSATLDIPMQYFALRIDRDNHPVGMIRIAVSVQDIEQEMAWIRRQVWTIAGISCLLTLVLTYWLVGHIVQPIGVLTQAAEAMTSGDYSQQVFLPYRDELGTLAEAFNRMSRAMSKRETQLRERSHQLVSVLEGMTEGVVAVDSDERILFANPSASKLLGVDLPHAVGRPLLEMVRQNSIHQAVSLVLSSGQPFHSEISLMHAGKSCVTLFVAPLSEQPEPGALLVLHDISDLRRLELLRQEFVANVSHELKTPLSSIKAYAETLREGAIYDPKINVSFISRIEEQTDRLHMLIQDLLSLARIESGKEAFDIVRVKVRDVVEASLEHHRATAESKQINLIQDEQSPDLEVMADAEGLREILDNLVDNGLKYTPPDGSVTVSWRRENNYAIIRVTDTGIGIPPEYHERLFERFFRVDKARSRELGGTGLGLSIVKHLAQSFGGSVSVESTPQAGSTFSVRLPAK